MRAVVRCGKPLVAGGGPRASAGADAVLDASSWVWELGLGGLGTGWEEVAAMSMVGSGGWRWRAIGCGGWRQSGDFVLLVKGGSCWSKGLGCFCRGPRGVSLGGGFMAGCTGQVLGVLHL